MDRATKLLVAGWMVAALAAQVWLLTPGWDRLPLVALVAFTATAGASSIFPDTVSVVLLFIYVFPVAIFLAAGGYTEQISVVWTSALVGAMTPDLLRSSWRVPMPWRAALVCWALVVVSGATIAVARELDFTFSLIHVRGVAISNTAHGGWPALWVTWILNDALVTLTGILWFDWLFGLDGRRFVARVAAPMAVSCAVMAAAAVYQLAFDVTALNPTAYGGTGRASGTMLDANVAGTIAALWTAGFLLVAQRAGRWRLFVAIAGPVLAWIAVWASGSRTAFALATFVVAGAVAGLVAARTDAGRLFSSRRIAVLAAAIVVAAAVLLPATRVVGPFRRYRDSVASMRAGEGIVKALWSRDGYGTTANTLIAEHPWFGVGVGSFPLLLEDMTTLPHDNAQNWFRHQLVELGLAGSLGWITWVVLFASFVFVRREGGGLAIWIARAALVGLVFISLFGVPTQEIAAAITFWTVAFAFAEAVGFPRTDRSISVAWWLGIAAVLAVFCTGTVYSALTTLRVPARAQRFGWPYSHGLYDTEADADGMPFEWTAQRGVAVVDAPRRWMALTVAVGHADLDDEPVDVKVWRDGELVLKRRFRTKTPVTTYVRVPGDEPRVLIDTWVSRVFRPGGGDDRELGLKISWTFVDAPSEAAGSISGESDPIRRPAVDLQSSG